MITGANEWRVRMTLVSRFWIRHMLLCRADRWTRKEGRKEGNALNIFYLQLYGIRHMVKGHSDSERGHLLSLHGLLFPLSSKGYLYASSHRQDNTYHGLFYTSRGALAGTRNSFVEPPWRIDPTTHHTMSECFLKFYQGATYRSRNEWSPCDKYNE